MSLRLWVRAPRMRMVSMGQRAAKPVTIATRGMWGLAAGFSSAYGTSDTAARAVGRTPSAACGVCGWRALPAPRKLDSGLRRNDELAGWADAGLDPAEAQQSRRGA